MSKHSGFTLIELMVVIAIVGILATIAVVNTGKNPDRDVRQEADRLTAFLRDVQGKALTAEKVSGISGKLCGFGIHYDTGNLQAYYASSSSLDANCAAVSNTFDATKNLEKFVPRNSVNITSFSDDIFFMIPTGDIYKAGSTGGTKLSSDFSIDLAKGSSTVSAIITPGGIIK